MALKVPPAARSVSFGIDRVSLPLEEPRPRPVGRPRTNAPKRPVQRVFRMAYCTTVTFHDATGEALHTIRQGAIPSVNPLDLCDRLLADAVAILEQRPDLRVVRLSDGAPEMRELLREALDEPTLGTTVYDLLDFWHVLEKLAPAGRRIPARSSRGGAGLPSGVRRGAPARRASASRIQRDVQFRAAAPWVRAVCAVIGALRHFRIAVSWGGVESLVISPNRGDNGAQLDAQQIPRGLIRLSIGLEGADTLVDDLERALRVAA